MKRIAYFGIKYYEDNSNKDKIDRITSVLEKNSIRTSCVVRDVEKWGTITLSLQELMSITFKEIDKSDFIILEMTEKGVGLGIEAGYAVAKGKRLIVLIENNYELSSTMKGIANLVIQYDRPESIKIPGEYL